MLKGVLDFGGRSIFIPALKSYLKKFQYSNVTTDDFIEVMQENANNAQLMGWNGEILNISDFLLPWLRQIGTVSVDCEFDLNEKTMKCMQFINEGPKIPRKVPLFLETSNGPEIKWMTKAEEIFPLEWNWVITKGMGLGYYQTDLDDYRIPSNYFRIAK